MGAVWSDQAIKIISTDVLTPGGQCVCVGGGGGGQQGET